jgi:uncharacterized protein (DUF1697 family)
VVFVRAANVGGHNIFRPKAFAESLAHLGVENVGAAGTFVVHGAKSERECRRAFVAGLPFEADLMIVTGEELMALLAHKPVPRRAKVTRVRRCVSVLAAAPAADVKIPHRSGVAGRWSVRITAVVGRFALSVWEWESPGFIDPNVVERHLGVRATTRSWETIERVCARLCRGKHA